MLTAEGPNRAWAWTGLRVEPAVGLDATRAYTDVPEARLWSDVASADSAWLSAQSSSWQPSDSRTVFAVRYLNDKTDGRLDCFLLVRADGPDRESAEASARESLHRLAVVPRHLRADALEGVGGVAHALRPFEPHPSGIAEIRKSLTAARCSRTDTRRAFCLAVTPFGSGARSWEPVWAMLAELPFRAMITVALAPYEVDPRLSARFVQLAEEYAYLAGPGRSATATFDKPYPPDPFAVRAAPLYADAAQRYIGHVYVTCITLAAEQPLPPMLSETLAQLVSGPAVPGRPPAVVLIPSAAERQAAWGNVMQLNMDPLETASLQGIPAAAVGPVERVLGGLVDAGEAAAVFRTPYEIPGHLPLFRRSVGPRQAGGPAAGSTDGGTQGPDESGDPFLGQRRFGRS